MNSINVSGTRKRSVARATLKAGNGIVRINSRKLESYEPELCRMRIQEPLIIAGESAKKIDVDILVNGGGVCSQADAVRLALARALEIYDKKLHKEFLDYDRTLLVADVRRKETHRPNCHGKARARRQRSRR